MAKVLENNRGTDFMTVKYDFPCSFTPGQCVVIEGRYFAIAEGDGSTVTVLSRYGGPLDIDVGTEVELTGPLGKGFQDIDCEDAVVIAGGTAVGACLSVLDYRSLRGLKTHFVAYTRHDHPFAEKVSACGGISWNTRMNDRPTTPFTPFGIDKFPSGTKVFVGGTKELIESVRNSVEQFGITQDNINLNY